LELKLVADRGGGSCGWHRARAARPDPRGAGQQIEAVLAVVIRI
jgi:hypothetical protein